MLKAVVLCQAAATCALFGLICCIQWVHYPMFARLDREGFCQTLRWHGRQITYVVFPLMSLELLCALWLVLAQTDHPGLARIGLAAVLALWASTGLIQVPLHNRLCQCYDPHAVEYLVATNWLRTLLWALRVPMVLGWLL